MLEKYLIEYCAPTLASLKTASLFCVKKISDTELQYYLRLWNTHLKEKGLRLIYLGQKGDQSLVYIYRLSSLREDLNKPGVAEFLAHYGYEQNDVNDILAHLKERLKEETAFPHEIGIFLGYPLGDVIGFIQNRGKNCKCSGCWKVYCNECETQKLFARFHKCRRLYSKLWREGKTVWQLTVAA